MSAALRPVGPRAGVDYPTSLSQFLDWFGSDADCARYLARLRWPDGFSCPKCGHDEWWPSKRHLYVCSACERQTSLTAGTMFEATRLPLLTWFRAAWMVSSSKSGVSAKELQRELGIGYHAAWLLLQKLRLAMVRPGRDQDKLSGDIEVDESYLGGPTPGGKRGRGAEGKVIIAIAVERKGFGKNSKRWKLGRTRIQVVPDVKAKTLLDFVEDTCEQGSTIYTDGLAAYKNLPSRGFSHDANAVSKGSDPAHVVLPAVHRVASLVKRWLLGTHHGGIGAQHVEAYLDEFIFRFNRRQSNARGLLFYRLLQNAVVVKKLDYDTIVWSRRGQAGKLRGPQPKPKAKRAPKGRAAAKDEDRYVAVARASTQAAALARPDATTGGRHFGSASSSESQRKRSCSSSSTTSRSGGASATKSATSSDALTSGRGVKGSANPISSSSSRVAPASGVSPGWRAPDGGVQAHSPS